MKEDLIFLCYLGSGEWVQWEAVSPKAPDPSLWRWQDVMVIEESPGPQNMPRWQELLSFLGMPISDNNLHRCTVQSLLNAEVKPGFWCPQLLWKQIWMAENPQHSGLLLLYMWHFTCLPSTALTLTFEWLSLFLMLPKNFNKFASKRESLMTSITPTNWKTFPLFPITWFKVCIIFAALKSWGDKTDQDKAR